ncbi:MAG: TRAP transporter fused permease subunit [Dehalococcoidia bacterium]|nr:TRAP transporter fused permease subunit [Dehalococcoidia bacterium]
MIKKLLFLINIGGARHLEKRSLLIMVSAFGAGISLYHLFLWGPGFGKYEQFFLNASHLSLLLAITFLTYSFSRRLSKKLPVTDVIFTLLSLSAGIYMIASSHRLIFLRDPLIDPLRGWDVFFGVILLFLVMEATRRSIGIPLVLIVLIALLYAYFGRFLSGLWWHPGLTVTQIIDLVSFSQEGIWGIPISISALYAFAFIIFGTMFLGLGGGEFLTNFALAFAGRSTGGPAKIAVLASGFLGSVVQAPSANVVTTGSMTIPMMKRAGYRPYFAAAVEATASTGGQIMPPVMGSTVFLMAAITGIPYVKIAIAAFFPAILFYLALFCQVHFAAAKSGLIGLPRNELPPLRKVLKEGGIFFVPMVVIIIVLLLGLTPLRAALWGIGTTVACGFVAKESRKGILKKILNSLSNASHLGIVVATGCAAAGIVMGVLFRTGISSQIASYIASISGGSLVAPLIISALLCLVIGMGVPVTASYIIVAVMIVPAATSLGVLPLAAHLFVFYFAAISFITPPVCMAAYVAAALAGANPMRVGITASRLGIAGYIVPFLFIYRPGVLLIGDPLYIVRVLITSSIGIFALAASFEGWMLKKANFLERILLACGGIALIFPGILADVVGIGLVAVVTIYQVLISKRTTQAKLHA